MNADKTEILHFIQEEVVSILSGKPMKLVDEFIYIGSYISYTERDVNICIGKASSVIIRLSIIYKSNPSHKIKQNFFPTETIWYNYMHHLNFNDTLLEKS